MPLICFLPIYLPSSPLLVNDFTTIPHNSCTFCLNLKGKFGKLSEVSVGLLSLEKLLFFFPRIMVGLETMPQKELWKFILGEKKLKGQDIIESQDHRFIHKDHLIAYLQVRQLRLQENKLLIQDHTGYYYNGQIRI